MVRAAARFLGNAYMKLADAAPDSLAKDATVVREGATKMLAEADSDSIDLERFGKEGPSVFADEKFRKSLTNIWEEITRQCSPAG